MDKTLSLIIFPFLLVMIFYLFTIERRLRKILNEISDMRLDYDKLNFRLFVMEKRQKLMQEKKIV